MDETGMEIAVQQLRRDVAANNPDISDTVTQIREGVGDLDDVSKKIGVQAIGHNYAVYHLKGKEDFRYVDGLKVAAFVDNFKG